MNPTGNEKLEVETDERFPSGPWTGFFLQPILPGGRHSMDMILTFRNGLIVGEGRDRVGDFIFRGHYEVKDGKCSWTKTYLRQHSVAYQGFNEGKGIWGTWVYSPTNKGGFHIWPVAMGDPTHSRLAESVDAPVEPVSTPILEPSLSPTTSEEIAEPVSRADNSRIIEIRGR